MDSDYLTYKVKYIYNQMDPLEQLKKSKSFTYIYFPTLNGNREDEIKSAFDITEEGSISERGWTIAYLRHE